MPLSGVPLLGSAVRHRQVADADAVRRAKQLRIFCVFFYFCSSLQIEVNPSLQRQGRDHEGRFQSRREEEGLSTEVH
jgi:hypothetical protein